MIGLRPRMKASKHGGGGVKPCQHVDDGHSDLKGRTIDRARDVHQARKSLNSEIVSGLVSTRTGASEAGERTDHQTRIDLEEMLRIESKHI